MGFIAKRLPGLLAVLLLVVSVGVSSAGAAGTVAWSVRGAAEPSAFSPGDTVACEEYSQKCDRYAPLVTNVGDAPASGTLTLTDKLPAGITSMGIESANHAGSIVNQEGNYGEWICGGSASTVTCTWEGTIPAGASAPGLALIVSSPGVGVSGALRNEMSVSGDGAATGASASQMTPVLPQPLAPGSSDFGFGLSEFNLEPDTPTGVPSSQAGGHPWTFTASLAVPSAIPPPGAFADGNLPAGQVKSVAAELPAGFSGDPLAVTRCTRAELFRGSPMPCPADTIVGSFALRTGAFQGDFFIAAGTDPNYTAIYNIVPLKGYPAEFVTFASGVPIYFYPSLVRGASGYRLRVAASGIPTLLGLEGASLEFFGEPGQVNKSGSTAAFLSNPADCSAGALAGRAAAKAWETSGEPALAETVAYPHVTGCDQLRFEPSLALAPSAGGEGTTQADEPSGYTADVKIPQTSDVSELATPDLRDATVTLPAGVSISPPVAQGLAGCEAQGAEGINVGSSDIGSEGQDLGDPQATELGAGHGGGNGSPYDDGLYHVAPGHCPAASTLGTAEAFTPLLPDGPGGTAPLQGHVYLAAPKCGGEGQPVCTEASAANGELVGLYLELGGSGVIVKIPGTVAADPSTGRLTATFKDNPQQPFSELRLHFTGGPRAPLANSQSCGQAVTSALLEPWSAPETPSVTSSSAFSVDWDGNGGACPAGMPFAPAFSSGTVTPSAGAFSAFALSFSRGDREQDLKGLEETLPPGLLAKLAGVPLCPDAQANAGTCSAASQIGTVTAGVGAGPDPFYTTGRVYLTGSYNGGAFGETVVVPAVAGPFNLGNVVVRGSIRINPGTAQATVVSDSLPQVLDGVPLRVRSVHVTLDRPGFIFNPTNCSALQVTGALTAAQGAVASVSSPFTASGCVGLPFRPVFSVSTQARTSKKQGASLDVKTSYPAGSANIRSVAVTLPRQLPARLTTIQQACPQAVFDVNPAGCPVGSVIGVASAVTPILSGSLRGPAFLVSHGGAAFPDLVVVLQGEGVTVDLTGSIDIKKSITSSTFASVPDAPISSFELSLPEGPHSGLAAVVPVRARGSLCGQKLMMPTTITGQNGAVVSQKTGIRVTGCPKAKKAKKKAKKKARKKGKGKKGGKRGGKRG